jgi:hypothetical protein
MVYPEVFVANVGIMELVQNGKSLSGAAGIDGNKIKWLWHRITKAGVLKLLPRKVFKNIRI